MNLFPAFNPCLKLKNLLCTQSLAALFHIREVDLILHVLREFENSQAPHVSGKIDPVRDISTIDLELTLADLEVITKSLAQRKKKRRTDKEFLAQTLVLEKIKKVLDKGEPAIKASLTDEEKKLVASFNFLTLKPVIFILNISEKQLDESKQSANSLPKGLVIPICIKLASDLYQLDEKERKEYLNQYRIKKTGLEQVIKRAYDTLGLITFYTVKGGKKISAWPIKKGMTAEQGAGAIHSDFKDKFIKAEVIDWQKLIQAQSWQKAREAGWLNLKGRDYQLKDGEVVEYIFSKN